MASNVSLVESESCVPLIPLVDELMNSNVISTSFLNVGLSFFTLPNATRRRTLSPAYILHIIYSYEKIASYIFL